MSSVLLGRLLAKGSIRRAGSTFISRQQVNYSSYGVGLRVGIYQTRSSLLSSRVGLYPPGSGLNTAYMHSGRGYASLALQNIKYGNVGNLFAKSAGSSVTLRPQTAWKELLQKSSGNVKSAGILTKVRPQGPWKTLLRKYSSQAFTVGVMRNHLLVPGLLAFSCWKLALAQRVSADAELVDTENSLYLRADDGRAFLLTLMSSMVDFVISSVRAFYLCCLFLPSLIMAPFADSFGPSYRKTWLRVVHRTLEIAGPAFIKWGQWAATRPDLFPKDLCLKLSELQTKAPEHSYDLTKELVEKSFGRKISDIFETFEEQPVASGSIAQVYRATLKNQQPGRKAKSSFVAVKVRHPGVEDKIKRDFNIMHIFARITTLVPALQWLRLDESVEQFRAFMLSQVDLAKEASHLSRFIYNFRRKRNISFPEPVYPLVHPAVLVESFEEGKSVAHYVDGLEGTERLKSALAHIGTESYLKMLLEDNFVHADLHPGNILVRVGKDKLFKKAKPDVIFLDVGMTAELDPSDRVSLLNFFTAVALRDGRIAGQSLLKLSKEQNCPNPGAFILECKEAFDFWGTPEGDSTHPAECLEQLLEKVRRHKVNIDGNVCTVMVTTLVLEGWQRKLDPNYNIMQTVQKLLLQSHGSVSISDIIIGAA